MSVYYFHIDNGIAVSDAIGAELPDLAAAQTEAFCIASQLLQGQAARFWRHGYWTVEVRDAEGAMLFDLNLAARPPSAPATPPP